MHEHGWRPRVIAWGEWFFRQRSWTPIPFILVLLFVGVHQSDDRTTWVPGLFLLLVGEGMRLWGVAVVGKESRTRGGGVERLATSGPYAYVRNPLYVGNFLLTLGITCISELLWLLPAVILLFIVQYVPIVLWEESVLAARFGTPYTAYCRAVPRWWPRWRRPPLSSEAPPRYQWRAAFWSERSTFGALALLLIAMLAKENLPHLFKYAKRHAGPAPVSSVGPGGGRP